MKSFKLVVSLAMMAGLIASTAFAGRAIGIKPVSKPGAALGTQESQPKAALESDRVGPPKAGGQWGPSNPATAVATPTRISPAAAAKLPTTMSSGLSGTYHIPGDFSTIGNAVAVLNFVGLAGNVTFELDATSYNEVSAITFGNYTNAGTYSVTVEPGAGIAATVNFVSSNSEGKGFAFNGAQNVTINGVDTGGASLAIQYSPSATFPLGDAFASTIYITGASQNIAIRNASIQGIVNNATWANQTEGRSAIFLYSPDSDPDGNTNVTIDHCTITNATYAFKVFPGATNAYAQHGITYTNNHVGGAYGNPVASAAWVEFADNVTYAHNIIDGVIFLQQYWNNPYTEYDADVVFGVGPAFFNLGQATGGHWLIINGGGVFHDNIQSNIGPDVALGNGILTYGLRVNGGSPTPVVYNTRVFGLNDDDAGAQVLGLRLPGTDAYHNSVRLTGALLHNPVTTCLNGSVNAWNNAFSNEHTGGSSGNTRGVNAGGNIDYNGIYSTGRYASSSSTVNGDVAAGVNVHGAFGPVNFTADLHLDPNGPSSAENIGKPHVLAANDIDGDARDTTIAGTRDAGVDQAAPLVNHLGIDVFPAAIVSPNPGGVPTGLAQIPTVSVKNNSAQTTASFNLNLTAVINAYSNTVLVSAMAPGEERVITFPSWTPTVATTDTLIATTSLGGDITPANDVIRRTQPTQAPTAVVDSVLYNWDASDQGWTRTADFVRKNDFSFKLGGPYSGYSMVTESPADPTVYTEGANAHLEGYASDYPGPNLLISPWLNLSGMAGSDVFVSFVHSIQTEPGWDYSWVDYTTDGVNWHHLGQLNDANGINWYSSAVYQNAQSYIGNPPDTATMQLSNYNLYGPGSDNPVLPLAGWTSNGSPGAPAGPNPEDNPKGPNGWIFTQLHITAATYPAIIHAPLVRFRYVAFSDALTAFAGWAVDNFEINSVGKTFTGGTITGNAFQDNNGNGVNDAEPAVTSAKVYKSYFGVLKDSTTTDGSGNYSFSVDLPGVYNIRLGVPNTAFTVPFNSNTGNVNHPADGSAKTQNFGIYNGSISGTVFNDQNDNAAKDGGEPGVGGWTIEVHKDSLNGPLVGSTVSAANGSYTIYTAPASYVVVEDSQSVARQTLPAALGTYAVTISGTSGSGTALATGKDFGDFYKGTIRVALEVDLNGNGVRDASDQSSMPGLNYEAFEFLHNGTHVAYDTIGKGSTSAAYHNLLDTAGYYSVRRISAIPTGWINTTASDSLAFKIVTSNTVDTAQWLTFKLVIVNGTVYADLNGNGTKDGGENGLFGKSVTISGTGGAVVATDSSGFYSDSAVGPGVHNITLAAEAGVSQTSGPYNFTAQSGNFPASNQFGKNFGQFTNTTVSGTVYRDRNNDGARQAGEEGLAGWVVSLGRFGTQTSDANGAYTFTNVGPGPDTLTETLQGGYLQTQPAGAYNFSLASGTPLSGKDFGNFKGADTAKYRTFTAAQLGANSEKKGGKAPKPGKPIDPVKNIINTGNLLSDIILQGGVIKVGLAGQLNAGGKEKSYIAPLKQADIFASFNAKGVNHTGAARGLDVDNKGNLMLKKAKSIAPNKKNDMLIADLLAFKVNLAASSTGKTPTGLGALVYFSPGQPFSGLTLDQIADSADNLMTNWEGIPFSVYVALDSVTGKVNAAFASGSVLDTATGWTSAKITWKAYTTVESIAFLHASGAKPEIRFGTPPPVYIPKVYALLQNYPNPFNPTTAIQFDLPQSSIVTLKVYNVLGQEVATVVDHQTFDIGNQEVTFDASNFASGVYLYRIVAQSVNDDGVSTGNTFTQVKKMMLIK